MLGVEELMTLFDSDTDKPKEPKPTDYSGLIISAILLPVMLYFTHIGRTDTGLNVAVVLGMCLVAIRIRWDLRRRLWFWCVIVLLLALHVPLFIVIQWPHVWVPGLALLPIGIADLFIILGTVRLVEKFTGQSVPADEEA